MSVRAARPNTAAGASSTEVPSPAMISATMAGTIAILASVSTFGALSGTIGPEYPSRPRSSPAR